MVLVPMNYTMLVLESYASKGCVPLFKGARDGMALRDVRRMTSCWRELPEWVVPAVPNEAPKPYLAFSLSGHESLEVC